MSKNLNRKSIAFGALIAIGSTVLAGTPANATATISISPDTGTTYNVLAADTFTLKVVGNIDMDSSHLANLAWEINNPSGATLSYTSIPRGATTALAPSTFSVDGVTGSISSGTADIVKSTAWSTDSSRINRLTIDPTTSANIPNVAITVRAFIDLDANGIINEGDVSTATQTIKFINGSDVVPTTNLDTPMQGSALNAFLTLNNDINLYQTDVANYAGNLVEASAAVAGFTATKDSVSYPTSIVLSSTVTAKVSTTYGATPTIRRWDNDTMPSTKTTVYKSTTSAATATGVYQDFKNSENVRTAVAPDVNASLSTTLSSGQVETRSNKVIRTGVKALTFNTRFLKTNADTNVGSGQPVKIEITEVNLSSGDEITSGGKTLRNSSTANNSETIVFYQTTDANGYVNVSLAARGGVEGTQINVKVSSGNLFNTFSTNSLLWKSPVADKIVETGKRLGNDTRVITRGQTVSLNYTLQDDFGQPYAATDNSYQISLTKTLANGASGTVSSPVTTYASLTGGKATVTWADNSPTTDEYIIRAVAQNRTTGAWTNVVSKTANGFQTDTPVKVLSEIPVPSKVTTADITLGSVTAGVAGNSLGNGGIPSASTSLVAQDRRFNSNLAGNYVAQDTLRGAFISGTIQTAIGSNAEGVAVTISAPGVLFDIDNSSSLGTITVYTNNIGAYGVNAYGKIGGSTTITVTSGTATATQTAAFTSAPETAATAVTITAPAVALPGRSIEVIVKVVDAYGNPIDTDGSVNAGITDVLDISVTGVGYPTAIPTTTSANGTASFKIVLGATETGTILIVATFDADGSASGYSPKSASAKVDVMSTLPTILPLPAVANVVGSTKAFKVSVTENTLAKTVVIKVSGRTVATLKGSTSGKVYTVKTTKGSKKVTVYVGGKLVSNKTVTVK